MRLTTLALILGAMALCAYLLGRRRAFMLAGGLGPAQRLHSLPGYHGYYAALWCAAMVGFAAYLFESRDII